MPQQNTISVPAEAWTLLTDADVTNVTFLVRSNAPVYIMATNGVGAPSGLTGAIPYHSGQGERNVAVADLFPGVTSANRLYAWCARGANVVIGHA